MIGAHDGWNGGAGNWDDAGEGGGLSRLHGLSPEDGHVAVSRSSYKFRRSCCAAAITAPRCSQERGVQGVNDSELVSSTGISVNDTLAAVRIADKSP